MDSTAPAARVVAGAVVERAVVVLGPDVETLEKVVLMLENVVDGVVDEAVLENVVDSLVVVVLPATNGVRKPSVGAECGLAPDW